MDVPYSSGEPCSSGEGEPLDEVPLNLHRQFIRSTSVLVRLVSSLQMPSVSRIAALMLLFIAAMFASVILICKRSMSSMSSVHNDNVRVLVGQLRAQETAQRVAANDAIAREKALILELANKDAQIAELRSAGNALSNARPVLDANSMFEIESVNPAKHSNYVVWYPRAGFGNRMMSLVSSIVLAVLTGRGLYLAPDGEEFPCRSLLNSAVCDWTFPKELETEYKKPHNSNPNVKELNPDAYFRAACKPDSFQGLSVKTLMCEDLGAISERFISANSCQYWAPLMFSNNQHALRLKPLLDAGVFGTIWKPLLGVSDLGGHEQSTECDVGVHVRDDMPTAKIDSVLLPCLESIIAHPNSSITLASMWPNVRAHIKKRLGDRVKWFSATTPQDKTNRGTNAADPASAATDVRALGICKSILFSKPAGVEAFSTLTMLMLSLGPKLVSMEQCVAEKLTEPTSHILAKDGCGFGKYQKKCGYVPKELGRFVNHTFD